MTHLRQIVRSLALRPGFSALVVSTLALAIGANSAIFSVLDGVVLEPLPYQEPGELFMIWESNPSQGLQQSTTSAATFIDWRERSDAFESMAAYRYRGYTLNLDGVPRRISSVEAAPGLFDLLGVAPRLGRSFTPEEEKPGNERLVILSHGAWENRFGADPSVVGSVLPLDGEPHTVVGVMPPGFQFPPGDSDVEAWSPLTMDLENLLSRPHRMYNTIGRLRDGATEDGALTEMEAIAAELAREYPESNEGWSVTLVPARDQLLGDTTTTVWVLFGAVSLVLLIGCVNVANLLLVRSAERSKRAAVSAAFGASPADLVRHSVMEGLVLGVAGGLAGLTVAWVGAWLLRRVLPAGFPRVEEIGIDWTVVGFTGGVALLCSLLFSLTPALRTMRTDVASILQDSSRGSSLGRRSRRLAAVMVASEVGLAVVLMVGAGLLLRSYVRLTSVDPGFRTTEVVAVAIELPPARYQGPAQQRAFFTELMGGLRSLPEVEAVGAVSFLPMSSIGVEFDMPFTVEGLQARSPSQRPTAEYRGVFPGYFEAMGIRLVAGRLLDELDGTDERRVVLINETVARRYFPDRSPIGQSVDMPMAGSLEIVGVVGDIRHDGLGTQANAEMFVPYGQLPLAAMHVVVHTREDPGPTIRAIRERILAVDPEQPVTEVSAIEDLLADSVAPSRFNMSLLLGLAMVAVLLAAVGVYGVVSYAVSLRTRELGVRMALGAGARSAVGLVMGQAGGVVAGGAALGLLVALVFARVLRGLLYEVEPVDAGTYVTVMAMTFVVGILAAAVPAARAARVDPVNALRAE
ncbi:MAG: ABC transporter permease [Gemmatimonadota bacterium]